MLARPCRIRTGIVSSMVDEYLDAEFTDGECAKECPDLSFLAHRPCWQRQASCRGTGTDLWFPTVNEAGAPPQVAPWVLQLHREGRPWDKLAKEVDWGLSVVGTPVWFAAVKFGVSGWQALRSPVVMCATEALEDPEWSVSRAGDATPIITSKVGRPMATGESSPLTGGIGGVKRE